MQRETDGESERFAGLDVDRRDYLGLLGAGATVGLLGGVGGAGTVAASSHGATLGGGPGYSRTVDRGSADYVVNSEGELQNALGSAGSGDIVYVDGTVQVGGLNRITVDDGVTLAGGRGTGSTGTIELASGCGGDLDSLLTLGDGVRVTGLEITSHWNAQDCGTLVQVTGDAEIDNCHVHHGGDSNIIVDGGDAHFHHSISEDVPTGGVGYGITVVYGTATIEYNYFHNCRHAVACSGFDGTAYTCRYNHFSRQMTDHVIDVHDPGGERFEVTNNVIETVYEDVQNRGDAEWENGFVMRGDPADVAIVENNWFFNPHEPTSETPGDWGHEAIIQPLNSSFTDMRISGNYYGEDAGVTYSDIIPGYDGEPANGNDPGDENPDDGGEEGSRLQLIPAGGEVVDYTIVVDGDVSIVDSGPHNAGDADSLTNNGDGTTTIDGATGSGRSEGGDTYDLGGEVLEFTANGPLDVTLDGEPTSVSELDGGGGQPEPDGTLLEISRAPSSSGRVDYIVQTDGTIKDGSDRGQGGLGDDDRIYGSTVSAVVSTGNDPYILEDVSTIEVATAGGGVLADVDGQTLDLSEPTSI